jgi:hypothetical protein
MSSPIWTPTALRSEARRWRGKAWRLVEGQHLVSTLRLVDGLEEQALLEDLLEASKPPVPEPCRALHYLLYTPFRYGPYPNGSRFRRAGRTPGVWYGAERVETAVAELAFYRVLFFAQSPDALFPVQPAEFTAFIARLEAAVIDLTRPPFDTDAAQWTHLTEYAACQALAEAAREADAGVVRYASARDPGRGANLAVLTCSAFADTRPADRQTWRLRVGAFGVQALREHPEARLAFGRNAFQADPRLAAMVWERPKT